MANAWPALFGAGWRVFFWAAGVWAVMSMLPWVIWVAGSGQVPFGGLPAPPLWHAHEMIFGYATAAIGGFFLTAVPNWTGARAAPRRFIAAVFAIWLAGRIAVAAAGLLPAWLVAGIDLAFLPVLAAKIATQLMARPKPQNMVFLGLISALWLANLLVHLDWMGVTATGWQGLRGGMLAVAAMIAALGGRVTPAFTRNALIREGREDVAPQSREMLDRAGLVLAFVTALAVLLGLPDAVAGGLALLAGLAAGARLSGWKGWQMRHQPIVWSLHLGYGMLALGLVLWGLSQLGAGSELVAVHVLGIGAIGGMTLAVMSRASLGHSGRPLIAPRAVAWGYALLPVAVALRWAAQLWPDWHAALAAMSGVVWIVAFAMYLVALWPVFWGPRADGRAG
ncbi:MAG: NnrS family protein [Paracoccus sp. (in: a-proteobacteria)]|nr:NnrS family protein [Paracoccus sp. (in: a-proteobacteria)]